MKVNNKKIYKYFNKIYYENNNDENYLNGFNEDPNAQTLSYDDSSIPYQKNKLQKYSK